MAHAKPARYQAPLSDNAKLPLIAVLAVGFARAATTWSTRARSRRALSRLSDEQLADIGLTRHQARTEARRPFWQP